MEDNPDILVVPFSHFVIFHLRKSVGLHVAQIAKDKLTTILNEQHQQQHLLHGKDWCRASKGRNVQILHKVKPQEVNKKALGNPNRKFLDFLNKFHTKTGSYIWTELA
jgi:hypothetical protein